jgi:hypothetical protein
MAETPVNVGGMDDDNGLDPTGTGIAVAADWPQLHPEAPIAR